MIRALFRTTVLFFIIGSCSQSTDVAVTETGNPTKVSLSYRVADSRIGLQKNAAGINTIQSVTILRTVLVIVEAALESSSEMDRLSFESDDSYLLDLDMSGITIPLDSLVVTNDGLYDELELSIDALEDPALSTQYPQMANKSILIQGYCDGDTLQTFVFTSELSAEISRSFNPPITLGNAYNHNLIITIDTHAWFTDSRGSIVDPRLAVNHDLIEDNIAQSFSVHEEIEED
jgi:hypothetical protein